MLSLAFIVTNCANPVAPQGGPKDETPPRIMEMEPPNYSTLFSGERLTVRFDEFVRLNSLTTQLMISPPLNKEPRIKTKGKSVVIEIDEQLRDSTTYTFFFGDAIVDITEANPIKNFEYVFSTGTLMDSMAIKGKVINAFDMKPKAGIAILLYIPNVDNIPNDSLPMLSRPVYVSRTNKEGEFELNNLRNIPYKLVALLDMNSNYLYDLPNEEIAFSDTLVTPAFLGRKVYISSADSLKVDTTKVEKAKKTVATEYKSKKEKLNESDSIAIVLMNENINSTKYKPVELSMFLEVDSTQQIIESTVSKGSLITFRLKYPCSEFQINPINFFPISSWNQLETNKTNDTILCWVHSNMPDSIQIEFVADSRILDTLDFVLNKVNPNARVDTTKIERLNYSTNIKNKKIDLNKNVFIESEYPLINFDFSGVNWIEDTLVETPQIIFLDSVKRVFYFDRVLNDKVKYKLIIPDSAMMNMKGKINDSIILEFETRKKEEYATIVVKPILSDTTQQWIVQLMNSENVIVGQQIAKQNEPINFGYILPAKYKLKAILDKNKNGRWDTGNYLMHSQAERVLVFNTEFDVRANWITEQNWELK